MSGHKGSTANFSKILDSDTVVERSTCDAEMCGSDTRSGGEGQCAENAEKSLLSGLWSRSESCKWTQLSRFGTR
jgi:hypothetical protein